LHVSWNGSTGVSSWQVSLGQSATSLSPVGVARRAGFETSIRLTTSVGYAAVAALDLAGRRVASSAPIKL
jgi:hypothetical protein